MTGGAQGIGFCCADALGEVGPPSPLPIATRAIDAAVTALRAKGRAGGGHRPLYVTIPADVTRIADDLGALDVLVNNAGIARSETAAEDVADEHWPQCPRRQSNGTFWCARAFGRHMLAAGKGSIVNVGSMSGFIVNRPQPQKDYNASKAAVHQLTRSLAAQLAARRAEGLTTRRADPSLPPTPSPTSRQTYRRLDRRHAAGRLGEPEEVASVVHFLASDAASLMTGSIVLADGGYTCW
ncbi:SDR family NAD(P)-dependent oxidoreductase [Sphingomonas sp. MMS24-JH45]